MKKIMAIITIIMTFSLLLSACSQEKNSSTVNKDGKISVYATVYPLEYFAKRIGGEHVNVDTVYPPGSDEHTFEPSQRDMMKIADSDMFFYVGLGLEGFVEKSKETLKNENVEMISVGEHVKIDSEHDGEEKHTDEGHEVDEHGHGDVNPHLWLDPVYSIEMAGTIKEELIKKDAKHKEEYEKNYQELAVELEKLDHDFKNVADTSKHKKFIVTHAAFGYWEQRYGLEQISISGLSSANEPSQKELEKIIDTANKEGLNYVLFEQNITSKLGDIVEKEIGAKPLQLHNLSTLSDKDIKNKETYFTLMNQNVETLKKALND
ncbi:MULTISPECIES: metal ABC transporter solute-binding protein, Zn/Mn family [unclassified Bacillus (in: firmicutes)]|uniref:metal ABC transporter solute-binding protein, Zn/Mn family n=1 Tax=unclassified Bacillus (in: firmicutes) TaxID=185979 RepID=UPI0008E1728A|nr:MULTISPECIES: zinc ABC transporter substrate-binding protein [unclassified Bacillus (in: firmicutes)]SFB18410.1 zinc transport system substrate-binding protein [Bacillus sp. UNCCL13]SFQ76034.1 zinc transport system substrate-binding protein [Bacillus sp. cl95]